MRCRIVLFLLFTAWVRPATAGTLYVPTHEFPTVQAAIDSAASGDTLELAPQVYEENPLIVDKDLSIRTRGGGRAIIDASIAAGEDGNTGSALRSVRSHVLIEDLVLRNGVPVPNGAGFWVWGGSVEMRRCVFENNLYGVLVFAPNPGSTRIVDCEFIGNGAGLWSFRSTELVRCRFVNNWVGIRAQDYVQFEDVEVTACGVGWRWGPELFAPASFLLPGASGRLDRVRVHHNDIDGGIAGIWLEQGPFELHHCESSDNSTDVGPSGLGAVRVTSLLLDQVVLRGNNSTGLAFPVGGLFTDRSQVRAVSCHITGNEGVDSGGGVAAIRNSNVELVRCTVQDNRSPLKGGGIYASASHVSLDSVLVAGNTAQGGGAIAIDPGGSVRITRSTLVGNTAGGAGALYLLEGSGVLEESIVAFNSGSPAIVCAGALERRCSDVFGNSDAAVCGRDLGGNLAVDPQFCDFAPERQVYDVRLASTSPLVGVAGCGRLGAAPVGCEGSAVHAVTWGTLKALYR